MPRKYVKKGRIKNKVIMRELSTGNETEFKSADEAAKRLFLSVYTVRNYAKDGKEHDGFVYRYEAYR